MSIPKDSVFWLLYSVFYLFPSFLTNSTFLSFSLFFDEFDNIFYFISSFLAENQTY